MAGVPAHRSRAKRSGSIAIGNRPQLFSPIPTTSPTTEASSARRRIQNFGFIQKGGVNTVVYVPGSGETFLTGVANNGSYVRQHLERRFQPDGRSRSRPERNHHLPARRRRRITGAWGLTTAEPSSAIPSDVNYQNFQALVWSGGGVSSLNFPGASDTFAFGINNAGIAVGQKIVGGNIGGFTLQNGVFTALDYPGANLSAAVDINEENQIVGVFNTPDANEHGYFLNKGVFTTLDFPDAQSQFPAFLNIGGDIYTRTDFTATQPTGMNDHGDFVGFIAAGYNAPDGSFAGYLKEGFAATAVPEPGAIVTVALFSLSLAGLALRKRQTSKQGL